MKITIIPRPSCVVMQVEGRLDATWAEHFLDQARAVAREGHHHLRMDASGLEYLSSAGIRSLLRLHREMAAVQGSFRIVHSSAFVEDTLRMSGFDQLLANADEALEARSTDEAQSGDDQPVADSSVQARVTDGIRFESFPLRPDATLTCRRLGRWRPWAVVDGADCANIPITTGAFALGIGAPGRDWTDARDRFGEFLAANGRLAYLAADGAETPDYLVGAERFVPEVIAIDALRCEGEFSSLLRFSPDAPGACVTLGDLARCALDGAGAPTVGFLVAAEVDGLVGVALSRSPGQIEKGQNPAAFPEIREWLSFCGERVHGGAMTLVAAVATTAPEVADALSLSALEAHPGLFLHAHGLVFPFTPLPNGAIAAEDTVGGLFAGADPVGLLHLLEDSRPAIGLGQSAFVRGACWRAPIRFREEIDA